MSNISALFATNLKSGKLLYRATDWGNKSTIFLYNHMYYNKLRAITLPNHKQSNQCSLMWSDQGLNQHDMAGLGPIWYLGCIK